MNCLWRDQPFSSINSMTSYIFMSLINRPCFPKRILVHCGTAKIDLGSRILVHFGKTMPPKFYYGTWRLMMISRRHMSSFLFCSISSNIPSFRCFFHDRQLLNVSRFSFFFFPRRFFCVWFIEFVGFFVAQNPKNIGVNQLLPHPLEHQSIRVSEQSRLLPRVEISQQANLNRGLLSDRSNILREIYFEAPDARNG